MFTQMQINAGILGMQLRPLEKQREEMQALKMMFFEAQKLENLRDQIVTCAARSIEEFKVFDVSAMLRSKRFWESCEMKPLRINKYVMDAAKNPERHRMELLEKAAKAGEAMMPIIVCPDTFGVGEFSIIDGTHRIQLCSRQFPMILALMATKELLEHFRIQNSQTETTEYAKVSAWTQT